MYIYIYLHLHKYIILYLFLNQYKSDAYANEVVDDYLKSSTLERSLSDLDNLECEGEISYNECKFAVKGMTKNPKAPGLDGICIEFIKRFGHY